MRPNNRQRSRGGRSGGGGGGGGHHHKQHHNPQQANGNGYAEHRQDGQQRQGGQGEGRRGDQEEGEPGLGGVAFLQNGRGAPTNEDPADEDQPDVPEFTPPNRRERERG